MMSRSASRTGTSTVVSRSSRNREAVGEGADKPEHDMAADNFSIVPPSEQQKGLSYRERVKMNQLQNLLHDALIATEHVEQSAIIRKKDCSLRASSVGFTLSPEQIDEVCLAFQDPPNTRKTGISFDGKVYKCMRADKDSIYGKYDKTGLILVRTATLILLGTYNENMFPSVCVEAMEKLADYFKAKGK